MLSFRYFTMDSSTISYCTRVVADGGTVMDTYAVNSAIRHAKLNGYWNYLKLWVSSSFGVKKDSTNAVSKWYCLKGNDATMSTGTQQPIYTTSGLYFDGLNDYMVSLTYGAGSDLDVGSGNFTIDCYYTPIARTVPYARILHVGTDWWQGACWGIFDRQNSCPTKYSTSFFNIGSPNPLQISTTTVQNGISNHILLSRESTIYRLFIDGRLEHTIDNSTAININPYSDFGFYIGGLSAGQNGYTKSYIKYMRYIKGGTPQTINYNPIIW